MRLELGGGAGGGVFKGIVIHTPTTRCHFPYSYSSDGHKELDPIWQVVMEQLVFYQQPLIFTRCPISTKHNFRAISGTKNCVDMNAAFKKLPI